MQTTHTLTAKGRRNTHKLTAQEWKNTHTHSQQRGERTQTHSQHRGEEKQWRNTHTLTHQRKPCVDWRPTAYSVEPTRLASIDLFELWLGSRGTRFLRLWPTGTGFLRFWPTGTGFLRLWPTGTRFLRLWPTGAGYLRFWHEATWNQGKKGAHVLTGEPQGTIEEGSSCSDREPGSSHSDPLGTRFLRVPSFWCTGKRVPQVVLS